MIKILPYNTSYENQVQDLYEIPVSGFISLSLQRKPHSLPGAHIQTEIPRVFIVIDDISHCVIGLVNVGSRCQIFQGKVESLPYFCDLRIAPSHQNGKVLLAIIRYINCLGLDLDRGPATTVVFSDNTRMINIIEKRAAEKIPKKIPYYTKVADIETFIFQRADFFENKLYDIRRATEDDIMLMQTFYDKDLTALKLVIDFSKIGQNAYYAGQKIEDYLLCFEGEALVGILGLWDTSAIKQTVVNKYHWSLKLARVFYNSVASGLLGYPPLPKEGEVIKTTGIHSVSIKERSVTIFRLLIQQAVQSSLYPLIITVDVKDPFYVYLSSLKRSIRKKGNFYLVSESGNITFNEAYISVDVPRI
jgi:hypothetical protein